MNKQQREQVKNLRQEGLSYSKISVLLGLSENTVKSFCRRNNLGGIGINKENKNLLFCYQCGKPLEIKPKLKPRKFCSDSCRMAWWNMHPENVNRKAFYTLSCAFCGCKFKSYGNSKRRFCSRSCYGKFKAKAVKI